MASERFSADNFHVLRLPAAAVIVLAISLGRAFSATYDVGPGQPLANIGDVPWESLAAGDTVQIHYRATPYREKWVIGRQGSAAAPITVRGIPGPGGELPIIDGASATTRLALDYASETRGIIKIGSSSIPPDTIPKYIVIENLDLRGARAPNTFTDDAGAMQTYQANASTIYVEKGENITVRGCAMHDSGNGFFVASSDAFASHDILVEANDIYDNGNVGSIFEHNNYTAAIGITFQYNHFGPLKVGAGGNNLKDRSSRTVVRYNWIEGGNRQLDLVDAEDSVLIRNDVGYHTTHVYGNILIEPAGDGNRQMIHYGGDGGTSSMWRNGTLYLYGNTMISERTDRTTWMRLSSNAESCDARDNIMVTVAAAGSTLSLLDTDGVLTLTHNWFKPGFVTSFGTFQGTVNNDGTSVLGAAPGFVNQTARNYRLAAGSACIDAGTALNAAVLPANDLVRQYVVHKQSEMRPVSAPLDIGAYERAPALLVVGGLSMDPNRMRIFWSATAGATSYDTIRGNLATLRSSGGNFATSVLACLDNNGADTQSTDGPIPAAGSGFFYLVRANGAGTATYDEGASSQAGSRDAEIAASPNGCP